MCVAQRAGSDGAQQNGRFGRRPTVAASQGAVNGYPKKAARARPRCEIDPSLLGPKLTCARSRLGKGAGSLDQTSLRVQEPEGIFHYGWDGCTRMSETFSATDSRHRRRDTERLWAEHDGVKVERPSGVLRWLPAAAAAPALQSRPASRLLRRRPRHLKSVQQLTPVMDAQLINYLRSHSCPVGYLLNFHGTRSREECEPGELSGAASFGQ